MNKKKTHKAIITVYFHWMGKSGVNIYQNIYFVFQGRNKKSNRSEIHEIHVNVGDF